MYSLPPPYSLLAGSGSFKYYELTTVMRIETEHYFLLISLLTLILTYCCNSGKISNSEEIYSRALAGSDELGRTLPDQDEVGDLREKREVGIFYFLWQGDRHSLISEQQWDLTEIAAKYPEVFEKADHEKWGSSKFSYFYFWGEPIYGYYRGDDYWVHLKSIQLLTDAEVDFLVIDATNTLVYREQSEILMKAIRSVQQQGKNPPGIIYYTNTASGKTVEKIYETFYREGAPVYYPETWYHLDGKPLIIGKIEDLTDPKLLSFFTFRESQWPNEPSREGGWPWIDFSRPQQVYLNSSGEPEIINVSVSQHPDPLSGMGGSAFYGNRNNWGRSYRNGDHGNPEEDMVKGYNFQEQWDYALSQDPPFIFITGWNEWVAGRWESTDDNPEHSYFCDQASAEYSRDLEPTFTAGLRDNYYMQMVSNIRRYKGTVSAPKAGKRVKIKSWSDWKEATPIYSDYRGDTMERDHPAAVVNPPIHYSNRTGRNDFEIMRVARDKKSIHFLAQTVDPILRGDDEGWMRLYIDRDRDHETGWMGYDLRVNRGKELELYIEGSWEFVCEVEVKLEENRLMYSFPLRYIAKSDRELNFEFKWSDNMQSEDPMDWYINGDVAPGGRFNYIYRVR